jgi:hypothetical protein
VAIAMTAMVGGLVALASAIPIAIRSATLFLGLLGWMIAVAFCSVQAARAAWSRPKGWRDWGLTVLGAAGVGSALLSATQLEIIRLVYGRPGLVWNVDWRYAWNHAQGIARFGGVDDVLDYAGVPADYHVGPTWLAAATDRLLGGGMTAVLFGLLPALCVLSAATALLLLLSRSGIPRRLAAAVVGTAFCLPVGFKLLGLPRGLARMLFNADMWFFASGLMLNSFLGVAVGLCSLVLLLEPRRQMIGIILGTVGLGSLIQIKPQFFVGLGAVAGIVGLGRVLGSRPFHPRSWAVFVASVGALALAVLAKSTLPGTPVSFSAPIWAPGSTGYSPDMAHIELLIAPPLLAGLAFAAWLSRRSMPVVPRLGLNAELLTAVVGALALLVTLLTLFGFPVRGHMATTVQQDLAQALTPLRLLLTVSALAGFAVFFAHYRASVRVLLVLLAGLIVASPLPLMGRNFRQPLRAYEAAEDGGLLTLLRQVPRKGELLIASDLADSAENYHRPLRGIFLTAYGGHRFYVANLAYAHHDRADAPQRLENLRAFFGSRWSRWHDTWLDRTHITHVLVSDRCFPRWWEQPGIALKVVGRSGRWTLLESHSLTAERGALPPPPWEIIKPQYGRSSCL